MKETIKSRIEKEHIEWAMTKLWESLKSHMDTGHADFIKMEKKKKYKKYLGSKEFHERCVREYATIIKILADLI
jgi:hypothetical protein